MSDLAKDTNVPINDCISRQAAIKAICICDVDNEPCSVPCGEIQALIDLPSVQPERKKGKWKRAYLDHEAMGERPSVLYCSICNQCIAYPTNYCPNCGSYNGGENEA